MTRVAGARRVRRRALRHAAALSIALAIAVACAGRARAMEPETLVVDPAAADAPDIGAPEPGEGTSQKPGSGITPLLAPIPFKNTQIGWGLFLMLGAIHRFDPDTTLKPSTGAGGGFYTENGSWGVMALEMARLQGDAWRVRGMLSHMSVRYDFFGIGEDAGDAAQSIGLEQEIDLGVASALRRTVPGLYLGPSLLYMRTRIELRDPPVAGITPPDEDRARVDLFAPGIQAEWDTRDSDYWPASGSIASLKSSFYSEKLGSSRSFQRYVAAWSWYCMPAERLTLATNLNAAWAAGDPPFYLLPSVGTGRYGLRGYTQGRYRDRVMTTAQAELRYHTRGRLGATAFGGFGVVAPDVSGLGDAHALPAGGLGLRLQLTKQFPMHMRFDVAWGRDERLFYFSVGEVFSP
jgi:surface antigen Omp85-like protein